MRIGELASRTGVAPRLLRYYEQQGLLDPLRSPSGYRDFETSDVDRVATIRTLLSAGLSTAAIRLIIGCLTDPPATVRSCPVAMEQLARQRHRLEQSLTEMAAQAAQVDSLMGQRVRAAP